MSIQIRRGLESAWESNNSNIVAGEPAITLDTGRLFVGTDNGEFAEFANVDEVAEIRNAENALVETITVKDYINITNASSGVTLLDGYVNSSGNWVSNSGYLSLKYKITSDTKIYATTDTTYGSLAVFSSETISSANLVGTVLSKGQSTMPTIDNPVSVSENYWVVVTARHQSYTPEIHLYIQTDATSYALKSTLPLTETMKDEVDESIMANVPVVYDFDSIPSIKGISHMGYHEVAPANTIPAFRLSKSKGFSFIECDIRFTADNVPVIMHNETINDTCCNASDGSAIEGTVTIANVNYADLAQYDACTPAKWSTYAGTKIPKFEEVLALCKCLGLYVFVDCKSLSDQTKLNILISLADMYGMKKGVIFGFNSLSGASACTQCDDSVYVAEYESGVSQSYVTQLSAMLTGKNKIAYFAYSASTSDVTMCRQAGLEVGLMLTSGTTESQQATIATMDKRIMFVEANGVNATQYLYDINIGDSNTGLLE